MTKPERSGAKRPPLRVIDGAGSADDDPSNSDDQYFDGKGRLQVRMLYEDIVAVQPMAVHPGGGLWLYRDGRFVEDRHELDGLLVDRLGNRYRNDHVNVFIRFAASKVARAGNRLASLPMGHLVNVANGMLDPFTGKLHPHDPKYLSVTQLPIEWRPNAKCPTFDQWLPVVVPTASLRSALLEDAGTLFDLRGQRQKKALFLVGPSRSGKSTFLRLLEALVGHENRSTEELNDLATNKWRAAELFGKLLNIGSDIRHGHITDVATFKKLTGGDSLTGERKFGHPFSFRFDGLVAFSMNTVPTVDDTSGAFLERTRPYRFPISFAGDEDPSIETAMMSELPGILAKLVRGLQKLERRSGYYISATTDAEREWFKLQSDRIALFLDEATTTGGWTKRGKVYEHFQRWAKARERGAMSSHAFYAALRNHSVVENKHVGVYGFVLSLRDEWDG